MHWILRLAQKQQGNRAWLIRLHLPCPLQQVRQEPPRAAFPRRNGSDIKKDGWNQLLAQDPQFFLP